MPGGQKGGVGRQGLVDIRNGMILGVAVEPGLLKRQSAEEGDGHGFIDRVLGEQNLHLISCSVLTRISE